MARFKPEQRHLMVDAVNRVGNKSLVARVFGVTRRTLKRWCKRAKDKRIKYLKDKPRKTKDRKISLDVECAILALRNTFSWGTAKIQQGLICLPEFMKSIFVTPVIQGFKLSRTAINNVLKKHKINGYINTSKTWKFFRASKPDELWQLDPKGPFSIQGQKHWWIICIDDYSRYMLPVKHFTHAPSIPEITTWLQPLIQKRKPESILTDNNPFKKSWARWCKKNKINPLFAHPYYPQDKGKVERAIRTISEEFIKLLKKFPQWFNKLTEYTHWYNHKRYHRGIQNYPAQLYPHQLDT